MVREFSKLGTEASLKNTLPSVNEDNENKQVVVPYRSRSGSVGVLPQEEYTFEVSSSGKAIYYMKQERENLVAVNLYEDKESPEPPVPSKQYIYEKGEDSVHFNLYTPSGSDYDCVDVGTNLTPGNDYEIWGLDWIEYDLYINDIFIKTGSSAIPFTLTEDMSVNNKVVITVKKHEGQKQYIYEKGEDSDVEFDLNYDYDTTIQPGTNLTVGIEYRISTDVFPCDFYINNVLVGDSSADYNFTLTADMSVNNRVIITVKKNR